MAKRVPKVQNEAAPVQEKASNAEVSPMVFRDERAEFLSKIDFLKINEIMQWVPTVKDGKPVSDKVVLSEVINYVNRNELLKQDLFKNAYLKPVFVPFPNQKMYEMLGQTKMQFKENNLSVVERNLGTKDKPDWRIGVMTTVRAYVDKSDQSVKLASAVCVNYDTPAKLLKSGASVYMSMLSKDELAKLWNEGHCVHKCDRGANKDKYFVCYINSVTGQVEGKDVDFLKKRMESMLEKNMFYGVQPDISQAKRLAYGYPVQFADKVGEKFTLQFHPEMYTFVKDKLVESKAQQTGVTCDYGVMQVRTELDKQVEESQGQSMEM